MPGKLGKTMPRAGVGKGGARKLAYGGKKNSCVNTVKKSIKKK